MSLALGQEWAHLSHYAWYPPARFYASGQSVDNPGRGTRLGPRQLARPPKQAQAAKGLAYFHDRSFRHFDSKHGKVLVGMRHNRVNELPVAIDSSQSLRHKLHSLP